MSLQVLRALHQLLGPVQQAQQQTPTYTNLQAADPNNQQAPADIQGSYRHIQSAPSLGFQPQRNYNQQTPQVGVSYHNLSYLANPNPAYPAHKGMVGGLPAMIPAYPGSGWELEPKLLPIQPVDFSPFQKLTQIGQ